MIPTDISETMKRFARNYVMFYDDRPITDDYASDFTSCLVRMGDITEDQETEALMVYEREKERRLLEGYE